MPPSSTCWLLRSISVRCARRRGVRRHAADSRACMPVQCARRRCCWTWLAWWRHRSRFTLWCGPSQVCGAASAFRAATASPTDACTCRLPVFHDVHLACLLLVRTRTRMHCTLTHALVLMLARSRAFGACAGRGSSTNATRCRRSTSCWSAACCPSTRSSTSASVASTCCCCRGPTRAATVCTCACRCGARPAGAAGCAAAHAQPRRRVAAALLPRRCGHPGRPRVCGVRRAAALHHRSTVRGAGACVRACARCIERLHAAAAGEASSPPTSPRTACSSSHPSAALPLCRVRW